MAEAARTIACARCHTALIYCPGCGGNVRETYNAVNKQCAACHTTFANCPVCGNELSNLSDQILVLTPQDKRFQRYCPACGKRIFAAADQCPHCQINISAYMDHIYQSTYDRVNQITLEEEERLPDELYDAKKKKREPQRKMEKVLTCLGYVLFIIIISICGTFTIAGMAVLLQ